MKAAVRPIAHTRDESVLREIEVDVVEVSRKVALVANDMLPVAALPKPLLAFGELARSWRRARRARLLHNRAAGAGAFARPTADVYAATVSFVAGGFATAIAAVRFLVE